MKIFKYLFGLVFFLFLAGCETPAGQNHDIAPIKINALGDTVWQNLGDNGMYFVIVFKGTHPNYFVGSSSASNLTLAIQQAQLNAKQKTTYDEKTPDQITLIINGNSRVFRPISQDEAELTSSSAHNRITIMKRYQ